MLEPLPVISGASASAKATPNAVRKRRTVRHYRDEIDYARFIVQPVARELAADLGEARIVVRYLWRPEIKDRQGPRHIKFWERYFYDSKGDIVDWQFLR